MLEGSRAGEASGSSPAVSWRVTGVSVQGVSHRRMDLPCQDALGYRIMDGGVLVVALADGAGSAAYASEGAQMAVEEALRALVTRLDGSSLPGAPEAWRNLMSASFASARARVLAQAEETAEPAREYAATLTGVIADGRCLAVAQVGDGAVIAEDEDGQLWTASRLQRGEYANETHFLTEDGALDRVVIEVFERPVRALAVMSDGLVRLALKMPAQEPHAPFFQPLFRFASTAEDGEKAAARLAEFLDSERVNARTDDDKSLVLAVRYTTEGQGG